MFSKENERFLYTPESCTSLLLKQSVQQDWFAVARFKNQVWIDEQIMAKEEVAVGEGVDMQTRAQVLKFSY